MVHKIDLHGISISEGIRKAETLLIEASFDRNMQVEIITGKSGDMQQRIIDEVLVPYKFSYYIPSHNTGMIVVSENEL